MPCLSPNRPIHQPLWSFSITAMISPSRNDRSAGSSELKSYSARQYCIPVGTKCARCERGFHTGALDHPIRSHRLVCMHEICCQGWLSLPSGDATAEGRWGVVGVPAVARILSLLGLNASSVDRGGSSDSLKVARPPGDELRRSRRSALKDPRSLSELSRRYFDDDTRPRGSVEMVRPGF
eukprot:scaffold462_cov195-Pinguiococcus_pyrenoidosus.AAC.44